MSKTQQQTTLKKYFPLPVTSSNNVKDVEFNDTPQTSKVPSKMMTFRHNRNKHSSDSDRKGGKTEDAAVHRNNDIKTPDVALSASNSMVTLQLESSSSRKRPGIPDKFTLKQQHPSTNDQISRKFQKAKCSFCESTPAAIIVKGKLMGSQPKPLCLNHYYTTRTVSITQPKRIQPISFIPNTAQPQHESAASSSSQFDKQLPAIQDLFAQSFIELQKEIAEESARSYNRMSKSNDPLSLLGVETSTHNSKWKRQKLLQIQQKRQRRQEMQKHWEGSSLNRTRAKQKNGIRREGIHDTEGGYMKELKLPTKLIEHKEQQRQMLHLQLETPTSIISYKQSSKSKSNPYKRRKPSKKSYWDLSATASSSKSSSTPTNKINPLKDEPILTKSSSMSKIICPNPKCESTNIQEITASGSSAHHQDGHCTSNDQAMTKGEIWGFKDRENDGYIIRVMNNCLDCGKIWRDEDT